MKIIITFKEADDLGIFKELCKLKGYDLYRVSEAMSAGDHYVLTEDIILTKEEAEELGIIPKKQEDFI